MTMKLLNDNVEESKEINSNLESNTARPKNLSSLEKFSLSANMNKTGGLIQNS